MSEFSYDRVWKVVQKIPRGKVSTYGQVAKLAGFERHARFIGYALHNIPDGMDIPWHRVINSQGRVSLPGGSGDRQRKKLLGEGIEFDKDRVNLKKFGWKGSRRA